MTENKHQLCSKWVFLLRSKQRCIQFWYCLLCASCLNDAFMIPTNTHLTHYNSLILLQYKTISYVFTVHLLVLWMNKDIFFNAVCLIFCSNEVNIFLNKIIGFGHKYHSHSLLIIKLICQLLQSFTHFAACKCLC
jgi:hypothetical protein